MKKLLTGIPIVIFSFLIFAQSYTPVDEGSKVHFVIDNFGIATGGDFTGLSGKIKFDPADLTATDFDVKNYPRLLFKSTRITKTNKDGYLYMFGNITIKGVMKEIQFPFTATPKNGGYLFEGSFKLNRRDFNVGGRSLVLSDELTVSLSIFAKGS